MIATEEDKELLRDVHMCLTEVNAILRRLNRVQRSLLGNLPFVKSTLRSYELKLQYKRDRLVIGKEYLERSRNMKLVETPPPILKTKDGKS